MSNKKNALLCVILLGAIVFYVSFVCFNRLEKTVEPFDINTPFSKGRVWRLDEDFLYWGPGNSDLPWPQSRDSSTMLDYLGRDLRGAIIRIDTFDRGNVMFCNFSGADFRGLRAEVTFDDSLFRGANLSGIVLCYMPNHRNDHISDFEDANISESMIRMSPEQLMKTKNYKEKDLSETRFPSYGKVDLAGFNLRNSHFVFGVWRNALTFTDADIAGATFQSQPLVYLGHTARPQYKLGYPKNFSLSLDQLYSTKTYKERNLGRVIFIYMDFRNADFRNQNLGYFDGCNLEGADLTNAYFCSRDERTLPPFARNNPIGVTDCNITVEQFKQTRNYKIWQDLGIPEVERILITEDNKKGYRYDDKLRPTILNLWFGRKMPENDEPQYVYRAGGVFVTEEIAAMLREERAASKNQESPDAERQSVETSP